MTSTALIETPTKLNTEEYQLLWKQAQVALKSGLLPKDLNTTEKIVVVMAKGAELGISPQYAASNIVVINGKPTCSSELMAALIYRDHGDNALRIKEWTNERVTIRYKRKGWDDHDEFTYSMEDAQLADLTRNQTWKKFPKAMLRARAISTVAHAVFSDSIAGFYVTDELGGDVSVDPQTNEVRPVVVVEESKSETPVAHLGNTVLVGNATRNAEGVEETRKDAGRKPASDNQLATIAKMERLLGADKINQEDMTHAEASERITELSRIYNERKGQTQDVEDAEIIDAANDPENLFGEQQPEPALESPRELYGRLKAFIDEYAELTHKTVPAVVAGIKSKYDLPSAPMLGDAPPQVQMKILDELEEVITKAKAGAR